jgi:hypothetical protein
MNGTRTGVSQVYYRCTAPLYRAGDRTAVSHRRRRVSLADLETEVMLQEVNHAQPVLSTEKKSPTRAAPPALPAASASTLGRRPQAMDAAAGARSAVVGCSLMPRAASSTSVKTEVGQVVYRHAASPDFDPSEWRHDREHRVIIHHAWCSRPSSRGVCICDPGADVKPLKPKR